MSHRNHYHLLLSGVYGDNILQEILGENKALCKGRARSMGLISYDKHCFSSAIVGGCCAIAVGVAWVLKESKSDRKVWCFCGDGVVDGGHFWEALQYAIGFDLPVTFVVENNQRATCTDLSRLGGYMPLPSQLHSWPKQLRFYAYKPNYPHVGTGKYVQF